MAKRRRTPVQLTAPDLTVEQFCNYIAPNVWDKKSLLTWPPDTFAVVASLLQKSGAYSFAVSGWERKPSLGEWIKETRNEGSNWRKRPSRPPEKVKQLFRTLTSKRSRETPVTRVRNNRVLCDALLQLSALCDEACTGVGKGAFASQKATHRSAFLGRATDLLRKSGKELDVSTLCQQVHHSVVRVLPKLHTPQCGMTIRSLTHNLALCPAGDVRAKWTELRSSHVRRHSLNLLLAPWPTTVSPRDFQPVTPTKAKLRDLPTKFGFFEYRPLNVKQESFINLKTLLKNARKMVDRIDGVVFPELALTVTEYLKIREHLMQENIFLICGLRAPAKNFLRVDIPVPSRVTNKITYRNMGHTQNKHHRWFLDERQIVQYGLGSCLNIDRKWWEHTSIEERELIFIALDEWLTICPLICEDLARQDPVAEVVRAVGPNLVIALLMDGPQLTSRWPARYATVLADDPGSSVLTLTSLGMCSLCRPPSIQTPSRAIGLWKDANTGIAIPIQLPSDADGVILSLSSTLRNEWAADGRDDQESTAYPALSGMHFVSSKDPK